MLYSFEKTFDLPTATTPPGNSAGIKSFGTNDIAFLPLAVFSLKVIPRHMHSRFSSQTVVASAHGGAVVPSSVHLPVSGCNSPLQGHGV